jgi:DNA-binding XRE family transcriptional regulator
MSTDVSQIVDATNPEWEFCDRLRKVRRTVAHLSQGEMAEALGVSQTVYAAWETGRTHPIDIVAVAKLIECLWPSQVTAGWLLGVEDHRGPHDPGRVRAALQHKIKKLPRQDSNLEPFGSRHAA